VELKPFQLQVHYKKLKIKKKVISDVYEIKATDVVKNEERYQEIRRQVLDAERKGMRQVFVDQLHFVSSVNLEREYARPNQNIKIKSKNMHIQRVYMNAAES
jgi:hypothetical protein